MTKTIALIAASGPTGAQVLKYALERGYMVHAIVRDPLKIETKHENLKVFKANVFEVDSLVVGMTGCDSIVSCLGGMPGLSEVKLYSEATKCIVEAMRRLEISRLVVMSAAYCKDEPSHPFFVRWGLRAILGRLFDDIVRMETFLQESCPDIKYTTVRPPYLSNAELSDKPVRTAEAYFVENHAFGIPRANVAKFILDTLETDAYDSKFVAIGL